MLALTLAVRTPTFASAVRARAVRAQAVSSPDHLRACWPTTCPRGQTTTPWTQHLCSTLQLSVSPRTRWPFARAMSARLAVRAHAYAGQPHNAADAAPYLTPRALLGVKHTYVPKLPHVDVGALGSALSEQWHVSASACEQVWWALSQA
jgi:hypothetical protein